MLWDDPRRDRARRSQASRRRRMLIESRSTAARPRRRTTPRTDASDHVRLLDVEPELGLELAAAELVHARRLLVVPGVRVPAGAWRPAAGLAQSLGVLIVGGLVIQHTTSFARPAVQLFGAGDVVDPRLLADPQSAWRGLHAAQLAVLDDRLPLPARRWPAVLRWLGRRLFDAQREQHTIAAISGLPRVEERILALLCHLAGRWGRVPPEGVPVALPVTHALLGQLIGGRRPTVSLALAALKDQELLRRLPDGRWLLRGDCPEWEAHGIPE